MTLPGAISCDTGAMRMVWSKPCGGICACALCGQTRPAGTSMPPANASPVLPAVPRNFRLSGANMVGMVPARFTGNGLRYSRGTLSLFVVVAQGHFNPVSTSADISKHGIKSRLSHLAHIGAQVANNVVQ